MIGRARTARWRTACAALLGASLASGCALLPPQWLPAPVDEPAPSSARTEPISPANAAKDAAAQATGDASAGVRRQAITLVVEADAPLRRLLEQNLDLARLQQLRDDELPDDNEWARLVGAAPAQARELLQTEGYFDAVVTASREPGTPATVRVRVTPGPRTTVQRLKVDIDGPLAEQVLAGDAGAAGTRAAVTAAGRLQPGQPFRNADWAETKQQLLGKLRAAGHAAARISASSADIDATQHQAQLAVVLDSGPLFLAGPLQISGLQHHDEATVRHLAGFDAGAPLTEARLLDYQDRLQKAGLFERATVSFDPDEALAGATPVRVSLSELPLQQATVGLGVSANTGPRASVEHTHRRLFGWAVSAHNKLEYGRDSQSYNGDFYTHPGEGFYRDLLGVQVQRVRSATDVVLSQRLRLGRTQDTPRLERLYFAELLRSRQTDAKGSSTAEALSGNYQLVWRDLDSVLLPTRGLTASLQGGLGEAFSQGVQLRGPFARVYGRLTGYLPLGAQWYGQARVESGQIIKGANIVVPDALGFRAGGDDSVRGYAYRSLAPTDTDGTVRSGLMLLTGSLELARPISPALPSVLGAVFIDAGRATDRWVDYKAALGYGVGLRWRSPIGPLKVDLAYGDELRKFRLHLSVGIAF